MRYLWILLFLPGSLLGADFTPYDLSIREDSHIEGSWEAAFSEHDGNRHPWCQGENVVWTFSRKSRNMLIIRSDGRQLYEGRFFVKDVPGTIDYRTNQTGPNQLAIFKIEGDKLVLCYNYGQPAVRPTSFTTKGDLHKQLLIFRRLHAGK